MLPRLFSWLSLVLSSLFNIPFLNWLIGRFARWLVWLNWLNRAPKMPKLKNLDFIGLFHVVEILPLLFRSLGSWLGSFGSRCWISMLFFRFFSLSNINQLNREFFRLNPQRFAAKISKYL